MFFYERHLNRRIGSDFIRLDAQSWLMSGAITAALFVAFAIAGMLKGTAYEHLAPYADLAVLAILDAGPRPRADRHRAQGAAGNPADHAA